MTSLAERIFDAAENERLTQGRFAGGGNRRARRWSEISVADQDIWQAAERAARAEIDRLQAYTDELELRLLDPAATCCADATRRTRELLAQIAAAQALLETLEVAVSGECRVAVQAAIAELRNGGKANP